MEITDLEWRNSWIEWFNDWNTIPIVVSEGEAYRNKCLNNTIEKNNRRDKKELEKIKLGVSELTDWYMIRLMAQSGFPRELITPELIQNYRKIYQIKKILKNGLK